MNTKEKVLQKCAELCGGSQFVKFNDDKWSIIFAFGGKWAIEHFSGDIQMNIDVNANEDSDVWPLAAQVLGIKDDEHAKLIQGCKEVIESATALYGHLPIYMLGIDAIVNPKPNEV